MRVDAEERPTKDGASHEVSGLTPEFMSAILSALEEGRDDEITQLANALHPADLADLIEKLSNDHRADLVSGRWARRPRLPRLGWSGRPAGRARP